jgi:hypothetical protein
VQEHEAGLEGDSERRLAPRTYVAAPHCECDHYGVRITSRATASATASASRDARSSVPHRCTPSLLWSLRVGAP